MHCYILQASRVANMCRLCLALLLAAQHQHPSGLSQAVCTNGTMLLLTMKTKLKKRYRTTAGTFLAAYCVRCLAAVCVLMLVVNLHGTCGQPLGLFGHAAAAHTARVVCMALLCASCCGMLWATWRYGQTAVAGNCMAPSLVGASMRHQDVASKQVGSVAGGPYSKDQGSWVVGGAFTHSSGEKIGMHCGWEERNGNAWHHALLHSAWLSYILSSHNQALCPK